VKGLKPKAVFLENVPTLVGESSAQDFETIVNTFSQLGYDGRYVVMHGYDVKCPQKRKRVYLLFYRRGIVLPPLSFKKHHRKYSWKKEPVPRMVTNQCKFCKRYRLIGNSVIPELTTLALAILWSGMTVDAPTLYKQKTIHFVTPYSTTHSQSKKNAAFIIQGKRIYVSKPKTYSNSYNPPRIILDPTVYVSTVNRVKSPALKKPLTTIGWCTLTTIMGPNSVLTSRQSHCIGTQIRFARDTANNLRSGMLNPEFLEYLQGYPLGWTEK
jgi:hypothetical protein